MVYAGFWLRLGAHLIDGIILSIVVLIFFVIGMNLFVPDVANTSLNNLTLSHYYSLTIIQLFCWGLSVGYSALLESSKWQATVGKKMVGIIVTDLNGDRISFARAFGRYFAKLISFVTFFIGFLIVLFTDKKQALHDKIARTLVLVNSVEKIEYEPKNSNRDLSKKLIEANK